MRIVFFGTPDYVLPILDSLNKNFKERGETPIEAVVTQPPKPVGRRKILKYSDVDTWAHKREIPKYFYPEDLLKNKIKADIGVLASYGAIVPKNVIKIFPHGIVVVHPSLLPKFRGSSPVPAAIITGDNPTGVTIFKMDEKLDHGPILSIFKEEIEPDDTNESLRDRLFERSAKNLVDMLPAYISGKINLKKQDHAKASYARTIKKADAFIDPKALQKVMQGSVPSTEWEIPFIKMPDGTTYTGHYTPYTIHQFIRAMTPWPTAWTEIKIQRDKVTETKRLKILKAHVEKSQSTTHNTLSANLVLDEVQLEGKAIVSWKQFTEGYPKYSFT